MLGFVGYVYIVQRLEGGARRKYNSNLVFASEKVALVSDETGRGAGRQLRRGSGGRVFRSKCVARRLLLWSRRGGVEAGKPGRNWRSWWSMWRRGTSWPEPA